LEAFSLAERIEMALKEWMEECAYIYRVCKKNGKVKEMRNSPTVALKYCEMQAETAELQGHMDIANTIKEYSLLLKLK